MMEKTIAQQLNVTEFPFFINDDKGNEIYREYSNGFWYKKEYDDKRNVIYFEDSKGYWSKQEYDDKRNIIYFENSEGKKIIDCRPEFTPEYTMEELVSKLGHNFKIKK